MYKPFMFAIISLLLINIDISKAEGRHTMALRQNLSSEDWQSIQRQILSNGIFLKEEEKQNTFSERTVLSGTLGLTEYIKASNTDAGDEFGNRIAISGDVLVISAPQEDSNGIGDDGSPSSNNLENSGAVYVFRRGVNGWQQEAFLKASNPDSGDEFGSGLAVEGDVIVVGAQREDSNTTGVNTSPNNSANDSGAVYVFRRVDGIWGEEAYLKASNTGSNDFFGGYVDISGSTIVVSARFEDGSGNGINPTSNNDASAAGAAYVFVKTADGWVEEAYVKSSNSDRDDRFAQTVSIDGDTMVMGAHLEDSASTSINGSQGNTNGSLEGNYGAVYVFQRSNGLWVQQAYIKAPNAGVADSFGVSSAVSGDLLVVGAHLEDSSAVGVDGSQFNDESTGSGALYVYRRNTVGTWFFIGYLKAENTGDGYNLGVLVDISGNTIVAGALLEDSGAITPGGAEDNSIENSGAAYVYQVDDNDITLVSSLKASPLDIGDTFGFGVAVSGRKIAIGARLEDSDSTAVNNDRNNNNAPDAGAVYLFNTITSFHPLGGTVVGLAEGNEVSLINNGGDIVTVDENGGFRFLGLFAEGETFNVSVADDGHPLNPRQECVIENAEGTVDESNVNGVLVRCSLNNLSINDNINTVNGALVSVPVQFASENGAFSGVEFSLDYDSACLNPDADGDGELDNVRFNLPADFSGFARFDALDTNSEIDVVIADLSLPFAVLPTTEVFTVDFTVTCPDAQLGTQIDTPMNFDRIDPPSFADANGNATEGTFDDGNVRVWASFNGDCDASGQDNVEIADLTGLVREIADDDGSNFIDAPEGEFFGSPQGCDANGSETINVADLSCMVNLVSGDACDPILNPIRAAAPELHIDTRFENDVVWLQAHLFQHQHDIAALSYDLVLDPGIFDTRLMDLDRNGIPDRVHLEELSPMLNSVLWLESSYTLRFVLSGAEVSQSGIENLPFAEGLLLEVGIPRTQLPLNGYRVSSAPAPIFANTAGAELPGVFSMGDIISQDTFE